MVGTFQRHFPKWQLPKGIFRSVAQMCISQVAFYKVFLSHTTRPLVCLSHSVRPLTHPSRSARPLVCLSHSVRTLTHPSRSARPSLQPCVTPEGKLPLVKVATWEIGPWDVAFGKISLGN